MLKLRARHADVDGLRWSSLQLRLRLLDIEDGSDAAMEAVLGQLQCLLIIDNRSLQELFLRIQTACLEVIERQVCMHAEADRRNIRSARLRLFLSRFDL